MNESRINDAPQIAAQQYQVTVGFSQVTVEGRDRDEALSAARRALSQESPRLWDVIFKMESHEFQVDAMK